MNTVLWTLPILLAVTFGGAGAVKLSQSRERLARTLGGWVNDVPAQLIKPLGLAEVLAAIGLIVPASTDIAPILTPIAASGLVLTMIGAIATHARRREFPNVAVNVVLAIMAVVIAWGRFGTYAF
jgi:hypothetical protein